MLKPIDIRETEGWVVVNNHDIFKFKTFKEAFDWQLDHMGHLMTEQYYTYHWLPEKLERERE